MPAPRSLGAAVALAIAFAAQPAAAQLSLLDKLPLPVRPGQTGGGNAPASSAAGCALGAAAMVKLASELAQRSLKDKKPTPAQLKAQHSAFMTGFLLAGCRLGGGKAQELLEARTEAAKKAQEDAFRQSFRQAGPVDWRAPDTSGFSGTARSAPAEPGAAGEACFETKEIVRRDAASGEDITALSRVCKDPRSGEFRRVISAG